jgi:transposase
VQQDKQVRRRERRSEDEKRALLDGWAKSGLSARAFSSLEGVKPSCLWRWKREIKLAGRKDEKSRPAITFAPVHVTKPGPASVLRSERVQVEVVLGRELIVRVFDGADAVQVGRLIQALAGGDAC